MKKSPSAGGCPRALVLHALFASAMAFLPLNAGAELLDRVVAVVGDEPILQSDVTNLKKEITATPVLASAYRLTPADNSFDKILDKMIEDKIIKQTVKELDVGVSDAEVENQINTISKQNNIPRKQLEDSIKKEGISMEAYKKNIKAQLERRNLFDRELRKGGGVSDAELRMLYDKTAETEAKLSLIALKKSKASHQKLVELAKAVNAGKVTFEEVKKKYTSEPLDWVTPSALNPKFAEAMKNAKPGHAIGPVDINGFEQLLLYDQNRKGSEDGFQKAKPELMMQAQSQDFERRLDFWIEQKKTDMHIVVNKL